METVDTEYLDIWNNKFIDIIKYKFANIYIISK